MQLTKKNTQLLGQIEPFMTQLPSKSLLKYAKTQDLIKKWLEAKSHAMWLGKCLKARFGGGGGNPAKKALKLGQIDEIDYANILAVVETLATTFSLIQTAWEEIEESISYLDNSPKSETELFLEILRERYDLPFLRIAKGCKRSLPRGEALAKIGRDAIWQNCNNPNWDGTFSSEQSAILTPLISRKSNFSWGVFVMDICRQEAKNDTEINRQLQKHFHAIGHVCDLLLQAYRRERNPNPPRRFKSEKWEDGRCHPGKKGGFGLPLPDSPIPSVTELNESISNIVLRSSQL